jgi:L-ascorbate metabolism protein UlaG (beta-lactamase superfamily)
MIITYYGGEFFKVQTGDITIAFNPIGKNSKWKSSRFGADVALISLNDPDFNGAGELTYGDREPFVISGPGEYEVKGIFIKGFPTETLYKKEKKINTIYSVMFDNISLCFLGALSDPKSITNETKEGVGDVDILFVPVAGGDVLTPAAAHDASLLFDPKIIIPMHLEGEGKSSPLATFLKEAGNGATTAEKLTIKKKDLEGKEGEIIILKNSAE